MLPKLYKKILFSLALTLVLAEIALRVYGHINPSILAYNPSRYLKYKARPGDLSYGFPINDNGFKDMPFAETKAPGEYRIAAIGDSFVFSMVPYEHSFCTVAESIYTNVNIMNFGVIGTAPEDYVTILKNDALQFDPDAVFVFIYAGNDFLLTRRKWYDYSALATVLHHTSKALRSYKGQDIRQNYIYDDNMTPFSYEEFVSTQSRYAETYYADADTFAEQFNRTMLSVYAIQQICVARQIRFCVVILPDRLQFDSDLQKDVAGRLKIPLSAFDYMRPQRMLAAALGERGIPFVDLYRAFADDPQRAFINNDIHYNLHGNRLVSASLPAGWFK